jgi:diacylglycerol kinase family enzyme
MDFFRIFPTAYGGNHVGFEGVHISRSGKVRIQTERPLWVQTDGEVIGMTDDLTVSLLPRALNLLI